MSFNIDIPVRASDLNYGNHLGYDRLVAILHQARLKYLYYLGFNESNIDGLTMIMKYLEVDYQGEAFFDDNLHVEVKFISEVAAVKVHYTLTKNFPVEPVASAQETILLMNYETKKIKRVPKKFLEAIKS